MANPFSGMLDRWNEKGGLGGLYGNNWFAVGNALSRGENPYSGIQNAAAARAITQEQELRELIKKLIEGGMNPADAEKVAKSAGSGVYNRGLTGGQPGSMGSPGGGFMGSQGPQPSAPAPAQPAPATPASASPQEVAGAPSPFQPAAVQVPSTSPTPSPSSSSSSSGVASATSAEQPNKYEQILQKMAYLGTPNQMFAAVGQLQRGPQYRHTEDYMGVERWVDGPNAGKPVFFGGKEDAVKELPYDTIGTYIKMANGNIGIMERDPKTGKADVRDTGTKFFVPIPTNSYELADRFATGAREAEVQLTNFRRVKEGWIANKDQFTAEAGWGGKVTSFFRDVIGSQQDVDRLRAEFVRVRNDLAVKSLPPGVASDNDIQLIMAGFVGEFSDPEQVIKWMETQERVLRNYYEYNDFAARHMSRDPVYGQLTLHAAWADYKLEQARKAVPL